MTLFGIEKLLAISLVAGVALMLLLIRNYKTRRYPPELKPNEKISGFAYAPFRAGQRPEYHYPTLDEIREDLKVMSGLTNSVRTYSTAGTQRDIPRLAAEVGINVTLGIWIGTDPERNEEEIARAIELANASSNVVAVLVGNESLFRHDVSEAQLIAYIERVRSKVRIPVSASEQWHIWAEHPALVEHVDMICAHILPYWESVSLKEASQFVVDHIDHLEQLFPHTPIILTEVGWPSEGRHLGNGTITVQSDQAIHLRTLIQQLNQTERQYFVMEAFDQAWKIDEGPVGPHWGIFNANRQLKFSFTGEIVTSLQLRQLFFQIIDGANLSPRGWGLLAFACFCGALGLLRIGHDYTRQYGSLFGLGLSLIWMTGLFLSAVTELHEMAEAAWTPARHRMFLPWRAPRPVYPKVSVHVPCYNEPPEMVKQTLGALADLDYPNFEVLVIDNNTHDANMWKPIEAYCKTLGSRFKFFHVSPLAGFKSGALNYLTPHVAPDADIIAVIDSDYCVDRYWLKHLVPHFDDPSIAVVQAPQDYRDKQESTFKNFCYSEYRGFFNIGMIVRNDHNAIIQHGTMTMIRRSVMERFGWAEWCICEDAEFGLRVMEHGHATAYVHASYGKGLTPDTFTDFKRQRFRWAYGAVQIIKRHAASLFLGKETTLNMRQRYHFLAGWLPWVSEGFNLLWVIFALAWSAMLLLWAEARPLPVIFSIAPVLVLFARIGKMLYLYKRLVEADLKDAAAAVLAGTALYHTIAKAVLYGLFTSRLPFFRTPKHSGRHGLLLAATEAREEMTIMLLLWLGALLLCLRRGMESTDLCWWVIMLIVLSIPYQSSLVMALLSAKPRWRNTAPLKDQQQTAE